MTTASPRSPFNLRRARLAKGFSLRGLAGEIGVTAQTIARIEAGNDVPRPATAKAIADFFEVEVIDVAPQLFEDAA